MLNSGVQRIVVELNVNGRIYTRAISSSMTLLEFLRDEIHLTGTKRGCDLGDCGCCSVLINGRPTLSCLLLACEVEGLEIETIEGLEKGGQLHPVQEAFVQEGAIQCGFCTPAMVLNAVSLLREIPSPSQTEIKSCIAGTICRCTGYTRIEKAVETAAEKISESKE